MLDILKDTTYRHLFLAQIIALMGTGMATVALGLLAYDLAYDLAGAQAGVVLGTALVIKMTAYIGIAPVAAAFTERLPWPVRRHRGAVCAVPCLLADHLSARRLVGRAGRSRRFVHGLERARRLGGHGVSGDLAAGPRTGSAQA